MLLKERIKAFSELGNFLSQFKTTGYQKITSLKLNDFFHDEFIQKIENAEHYNGWFTKDNVLFAIEQWAEALTEENLSTWIGHYSLENIHPKTIGVIMAGNIPLVGFHDYLCVLISGHAILIKQSSNDSSFLPLISKILKEINSGFKSKITFTEGKMDNYDAIIATGSNNTARYFEYYFKDVPSIIRKNRNSVAVLTGEETDEQLHQLGEDIFRYYGLGCRSVSKLFVPKDYDFDKFFKAIYPYHDIIHGNKYANNYDYNKAVYLMSNYKLLENGFLMLKELMQMEGLGSTDDGMKQYRTNNLVSGSNRTIDVLGYTGGSNALDATNRQALQRAVNNYNQINSSLNLRLTFGTNYQAADLVVYVQSNLGAGGLAGFPSGGRPYKWARIGPSVSSRGYNYATHVITHEMGHCIGLRHTDWFRRYCDGSNEGTGSDGAIHIPGTPTGIDISSTMMSCPTGYEDGNFNANDIRAIEYLY